MTKLKIYLYSFGAFLLTLVILSFPGNCLLLALNGLNLWFEKMIPTLFPFMVLSGMIIQMNLTDSFVKALNPVLGRLFHLNSACIYGIIVGFLCGFPMGAHVAARLYEEKQITKEEASLLLAFCNNIGPVYFLSFVLPTLSLTKRLPFLLGMYGLPFLYGLFLRYVIYGGRIAMNAQRNSHGNQTAPSLLQALDDSIFRALGSIAKLGGYMIFFNLLFILPVLATRFLPVGEKLSGLLTGFAGCFLEITGGIGLLGDKAPFFVLCILPFGGLSCIAQTYSMIKDTDLSVLEYVMHKLILTAITVCFYLLSADRWF